jgi:hypothetical protein
MTEAVRMYREFAAAVSSRWIELGSLERSSRMWDGVRLKSAAKSRGSLSSKQRYITPSIESHPNRRLDFSGVNVVASAQSSP